MILIGSSSEDIHLQGEVVIAGSTLSDRAPDWYHRPVGEPSHSEWEQMLGRGITETPVMKGKFTMDNTVMEMKDYSLIMKIMYKAVESIIAKGFDGKKDYNNPEFRMMMSSAADASLSGLKISGGMKNYVLEGILAMANGHFFKGLRLMCKRLKSI